MPRDVCSSLLDTLLGLYLYSEMSCSMYYPRYQCNGFVMLYESEKCRSRRPGWAGQKGGGVSMWPWGISAGPAIQATSVLLDEIASLCWSSSHAHNPCLAHLSHLYLHSLPPPFPISFHLSPLPLVFPCFNATNWRLSLVNQKNNKCLSASNDKSQ